MKDVLKMLIFHTYNDDVKYSEFVYIKTFIVNQLILILFILLNILN